MLGLEVDEPLESVVARLKENGARVNNSIVQDDAGRFANLEDPEGNPIYLWETHHG